MRTTLAALIALALALGLSACRSPDEVNRDADAREAQRYALCLQAGGSYWADEPHHVYRCEVPR